MPEKGKRAAYTLEFKLEAVRLVQGGQAKAVTAKVLGIPEPTLGNWVRLAAQGKLAEVGAKPVSAEHQKAPLPDWLSFGEEVYDTTGSAPAILLD